MLRYCIQQEQRLEFEMACFMKRMSHIKNCELIQCARRAKKIAAVLFFSATEEVEKKGV
jgi:hypothetical protein